MIKGVLLTAIIVITLAIIGLVTVNIILSESDETPEQQTQQQSNTEQPQDPVEQTTQENAESIEQEAPRRAAGGGGGDGAGAGDGGSGSGSGGGEGDSGGSSGAQDCYEVDLAFSLGGFSWSDSCNEFQGEVCIDKTVDCSVTLQNLDNNEGGDFGVKIDVIPMQGGGLIATETVSELVGPREQKTFSHTFQIQSTGEDGDANRDLKCTFSVPKVAKKQICSSI